MKIELLIAGWLFNALLILIAFFLVYDLIDKIKDKRKAKRKKRGESTPEQLAVREEYLKQREIEKRKRWPIKISVTDESVNLPDEWVIVQTRWYPWPEDTPTKWQIYHRKVYWTKELAETAIKSMESYTYQRKQEFRIIQVNKQSPSGI